MPETNRMSTIGGFLVPCITFCYELQIETNTKVRSDEGYSRKLERRHFLIVDPKSPQSHFIINIGNVRAIMPELSAALTEYFASSQAQHLVSFKFSTSAFVDSQTVLERAPSSAYQRTLFSKIIAVKITHPAPAGGARHITWTCRIKFSRVHRRLTRLSRSVTSVWVQSKWKKETPLKSFRANSSLRVTRTSDFGKSVASEMVLIQSSLKAVRVSGNNWK